MVVVVVCVGGYFLAGAGALKMAYGDGQQMHGMFCANENEEKGTGI